MSEEGEERDDTRKFFTSEEERNTPDLSREGIMDSVGSDEK